jgi:hypothetical protein
MLINHDVDRAIDLLALIPFCSLLNRARGTQLYSFTTSTTIGRLVSMGVMAAAVALAAWHIVLFPVVWALLMLWCIPAWDAYWSAEIGDSTHSKAWGCAMMFVRQLLILPAFAAVAYVCGGNYAYCAIAGLLWLPYLIFGIVKKDNPIAYSEFTNGALIGTAFYLLIISGY